MSAAAATAPAIPASSADAHALLSHYHPPEQSHTLLHDKIHNKPLPLHTSTTNTTSTDARTRRRQLRATKSRPARKPAPLTAREKRSLAVHTPPQKKLEYATFTPLRELWLEYARALVAMGGGAPAVAQRLAAGDLHGAVVCVVRSRCVDRVGICGVVVKDTRGALLIVPEEGGGKTVPKEYTVFRVCIPPTDEEREKLGRRDMVLDLHGQQMMFRAAERAGRKFKAKPMLEL